MASPELLFLVAGAGPHHCSATFGRLSEGVDWARAGAMAHYHRVRPIVFRRALDQDLPPPDLRADWEGALRANAFRNLNLLGELVKTCRALAAAGVDALPHKGPLLAMAAYGDLAAREFADLDLLVRGEAVSRALETLGGLGYRVDPELAWLSSRALRRWTGEISCQSEAGDSIDLHWRFSPPHYPIQLDPRRVWPHATRLQVAGTTLPSLGPEALFLVLAVHGAKHAWEALGWLADLAWLVSAPPAFDWTLAAELSLEAGCTRPFRLAAGLIAEVFAAELPASLVDQIARDGAVADLSERVLARWAAGPLEAPRSPELLAFAARLSPGPLQTARHVAGLLAHPTERDWRRGRLPEPLFCLYAPQRAMRLAQKYLSPAARTGDS